MTPEQKAVELLTKYRRHLPINTVTDLEAKGCATIAAEEIEKELARVLGPYPNISEYWAKVKQQIEKI